MVRRVWAGSQANAMKSVHWRLPGNPAETCGGLFESPAGVLQQSCGCQMEPIQEPFGNTQKATHKYPQTSRGSF
eukprot:15471808-Alexandrium_andersonii.AAC.1